MKIEAEYTFDEEVWREYGYTLSYVALGNRAPPPYLRQVRVEATLDVDEDGCLAGIEIVADHPPPRGTDLSVRGTPLPPLVPKEPRPYVCDECGRLPNSPILRDDLWATISHSRGLLCWVCAERKLGRRIGLAELQPCAGNDHAIALIARLSPETDTSAYPAWHRVRRILDADPTLPPVLDEYWNGPDNTES